MKTTLKALICTALCCAAWSAFAVAPPPSTTTLTFKAPQASPSPTCGGSTVGSVSLNGAGTPDVAILTSTYEAPTPTPPASPTPVAGGKVQLRIATDGLGNPTSVANNVCWVRIDGAGGGVDVDANGQACFPVDLDGLSTLGLTDCNGNPLQNVTCATPLVGFEANYIGEGNAHNSSIQTDLTIECGDCGTSTDLTIGLSDVDGQGSPPPGYSGCWEYTLTVQNCTPFDLTGVKAQGGTAGWLNANDTSVTASSGTATISYNRRNQVITWIGDLAQGESVDITVHVCGTIKPSTACGTTMYLSGPWSATYTDPNTGLPVKTDYTGRAQLTVTCPP